MYCNQRKGHCLITQRIHALPSWFRYRKTGCKPICRRAGLNPGLSGMDYRRLWPLPVVQPWFEDPDPVDGWIAEEEGPAEAGALEFA